MVLLNKTFSTKSMALCLLFVSACVFFHLWCLNRVLDFTNNFNSIMLAQERLKRSDRSLKHILKWTKSVKGDRSVREVQCPQSCIITKDKGLFDGDYTKFDAILFNEGILKTTIRPIKRDPSQMYIFNTIESSYSVPACEMYNDGFFNWTFTYRLDSDIVWSYFQVRSLEGAVVAPSITVKWKRSSSPVKRRIRLILKRKRRAAAWLVSHCEADSLRDDYLTRLQEHLFHFSLKIDVYGQCSKRKCPDEGCDSMILKNYYFYMAFENSFAEDYVTEKIMHGYRNYAIPIVYGGANYSRFLPPGSYINARDMHPYNLAFAMYQVIQNTEIYYSYFKWTNLYVISSDHKIHPMCELCHRLYKVDRVYPAKQYFRLWWNRLNGMKWCLPQEFWNETANVNLDGKHIFHLY